jgi:hypothetical protein
MTHPERSDLPGEEAAQHNQLHDPPRKIHREAADCDLDARRARAHAAARHAHAAAESARLAVRVAELATRALALHASDAEVPVNVPTSTPPAEELSADAPSYRSTRPPGNGENQMSTERLDEVAPL